ncbi:MAG: guanitoxin biosynthesis pre-guanitoxin forming N-methyltransferase GntF [Gemmataceae bacterium]
MTESTGIDLYTAAFNPRNYLRQYYSTPHLTADDSTLLQCLCGWLERSGHIFSAALDLGCGPTVHYSFAISPYAHRIDLADYLPANLAEIRRWLDNHSDAHDWDALFRGVLACQGVNPDVELERRKALYRSRVSTLLTCDLRHPNPLGRSAEYDLVTSFFCCECIAADRDDWKSIMGRILSLVRPGGSVFFASMRDCRQYAILGRWFPSTPVTEQDFWDVFTLYGFEVPLISVRAVAAPAWVEDGFDHIIVASATRAC